MKLHYILLKNAAFLLFSIPISLLFVELAIATPEVAPEDKGLSPLPHNSPKHPLCKLPMCRSIPLAIA
ncbi:MAG: hypothetical protein ACK5C9_07285 [Pseudanabaena sp.]